MWIRICKDCAKPYVWGANFYRAWLRKTTVYKDLKEY